MSQKHALDKYISVAWRFSQARGCSRSRYSDNLRGKLVRFALVGFLHPSVTLFILANLMLHSIFSIHTEGIYR